MIKADRNQLGNTKNPFQTDARKVLCICSAGLLRSPTCANVLHREFGFNTRAAGAAGEYALIPVTEALLYWADEVVLMGEENYHMLDQEERELIEGKYTQLNLPDEHNWNSEALQSAILAQYKKAHEETI